MVFYKGMKVVIYKLKTSQGHISVYDSNSKVDSNYSTVVFIHGHCSNKQLFSKQMESGYLPNYRCIFPDLPGYGESDPPVNPEQVYNLPGFAAAIQEVISILKLKNIVIVGWSLGGHIALELISRLPQLRGLLITGTPPMEISATGLSKGFKIADPKILECFGKGNLTLEESQLLATVSGYDYSIEKQFIVEAVLQTDNGAKTIYPQSLLRGVGQDERVIVREWPKPIAVLAGEKDTAINNDYIINEVKFRNLWRDKVHVIADAGHALFLEKPEQFKVILVDFLQDVFSK
jgi:pimeloyl-ACP methyl ester carboxylesterase